MKKAFLVLIFVWLVCNIAIPQSSTTNLTTSDKILYGVLPWLVALIISVVSVITNWRISQNQMKNMRELTKAEINASNIANKRQDWINTLRNQIANLIAHRLVFTYKFNDEKYGDTMIYRIPEFIKLSQDSTNIDLLLNYNEEESKLLMQTIRKFIDVKNSDFEDLAIDTTVILDLSKRILKKEWERVKKGE